MNKLDSTFPAIMETETAISQAGGRVPTPLVGTITSLESLREHLQWAIELEHTTIPPYLCALYSIEPGKNLEAVEVITSVVVEEMLHLTLAANLLNAVGGRPRLAIPKMMPGERLRKLSPAADDGWCVVGKPQVVILESRERRDSNPRPLRDRQTSE